MKVLLTGGSGLLGKELLLLDNNIYAPTHSEMDITNRESVLNNLEEQKPEIVIHAAAYTSPPRCDANPDNAVDVNVVGTANLVHACRLYGMRLVYISTDYVFDGKRGQYTPNDSINPTNKYAMTKAAGEYVVRTYDNTLVIRTSFCERVFPYEKAFIDQYTSRDYIDVIAPLILKEAVSRKMGIIHVGTGRKSVYELAKKRKDDIGMLKISEVGFIVPEDTSFS